MTDMNEQWLVAAYVKAKEQADFLEKALELHFIPLAQAATTSDEVMALVRRCPDSVTRVFLLDAARQKKVNK